MEYKPDRNERSPSALFSGLAGVFIAALVIADVFHIYDSSLSWKALTALALILVLALAGSFDKLAVGKLFSAERHLKKEEEKRQKAEARSDELIKSFVNFSSNFHAANTNRVVTNNLITPDIAKLVGVTPADQEEVAKAKEAEIKEGESKGGDTPVPDATRPSHVRTEAVPTRAGTMATLRAEEQVAIEKFAARIGANLSEIQREVRFTSAFQFLDPIMERSVLFDGYLKQGDEEIFIEARRSLNSPMTADRLYIMLSKINLYRNAKNVKARLVLLLIGSSTNDTRGPFGPNRLMEWFRPAIESNLLEIVSLEIPVEEIEAALAQPHVPN